MLGSKPTFFMSLLNIISTQPIWMTSIHVFHGGRTMYPWVPGESMYTKVSHQISWTITSSLQPFVIPSHLHWENLWWARNSANPEISSVVQRRDMWREPSHQLWAQLWKKNMTRWKSAPLSHSEDRTPKRCALSSWPRSLKLCWVPSL